MGNTHAVAVIKSLQGLLEVESGNSFTERTRVGHKIEELTTTGKVEDNVVDILFFGWLFVKALLELDLLEHVGMLQLFHYLDLLEYEFKSLL